MVKKTVFKTGKSCKINIGFGFMLRRKLTDQYRYYYVSTNHLLFDRTYTISTRQDIKNFINMVHDKNAPEDAYFKRPNSSWMFTKSNG